MPRVIPVTAIVPTLNRRASLEKMLHSLARQSAQPAEMIIVDASDNRETERLCQLPISGLETAICYHRASQIGAATQRNQGATSASYDYILFLDDDIEFHEACIAKLWKALASDARAGGVNAMIINQKYFPPGRLSRTVFRLLNGGHLPSYAGRCIGPAVNILPEDSENLPEVVEVEWLNTTCTLYRKQALPMPPFQDHFTGYSLLEDLALSLVVGRTWKLANARTARIYHDSQPADYKGNKIKFAKMELVNRHFIMTQILKRESAVDYAKLMALEVFGVLTPLRNSNAWKSLLAVLVGKASATWSIVRVRRSNSDPTAIPQNSKQFVSN